ncbi:MAG: hypothetical protein KatS3mg044_0150 [Rhodothermaceae bacterium]|nr:MAG: hypothetical protein KatS3mg044_0150 [Rhodothermaceae bacterium]
MRTVTALTLLMLLTVPALGQQTDFKWNVPATGVFEDPYTVGIHSGARDVKGPLDLDHDGKIEVIVSDYTGGGRVHVLENVGPDMWELVYSSPVLDSTASTNNIRAIGAGDLDGDGHGEFMFLAGRSYSEFNPNIDNLPPGLYVFEHTGADNDYGTFPASIYTFPDDLPDRWRAEQITVFDVDGDGVQEVMFGNNGSNNRYDNWYVLSVTGDIGSGFEAWVEELRLSSRDSEDFDPVNRGGGSPYGMVPADLDGDGTYEIAMQSWNNFNFTNARATGPDTYQAPGAGDPNVFLQAAPADHVALFGCVATDIDGNGDDEVFCPNLQTGNVAILNYEAGEDPLQVTTDNVVLDLIPGLSALGITAGDLDGDGKPELIGSGPSYTAGQFEQGNPPRWINISEFAGGDPEDPTRYSFTSVSFPDDMVDAFDLVVRDSAGTITEFREDGDQGPEFVSKLAYLGDADGDGWNEVALAFQGVDDSTFVFDEVFNPSDSTYTRTIREANVNPNRVFLRVVAGNGLAVTIQDERIVLPSDYILEQNYPNPFNPTTTIRFTLPVDKRVSVRVYDVAGRLVRTLVNDRLLPKGSHEVAWDGTSDAGAPVASGTYLYTLEYGNFRQSKTMVLLK